MEDGLEFVRVEHESVDARIWDTLAYEAIESRLAAYAQATGNVHSVTGYYAIERIYGNG